MLLLVLDGVAAWVVACCMGVGVGVGAAAGAAGFCC